MKKIIKLVLQDIWSFILIVIGTVLVFNIINAFIAFTMWDTKVFNTIYLLAISRFGMIIGLVIFVSTWIGIKRYEDYKTQN